MDGRAQNIASVPPAAAAFTGVLIEAGARVSMDGRGRWMDNVFIERLWLLKYEDVYLRA
jgi:putative transposase